MRGNKDGKAMKPILKSKLKLAVLAPPCMLSPGLQAERKQGRHWGYPFIELIMRYGVDIELLPCPESTFKGYSSGLRRNKHGIDYYTHLDGTFTNLCGHLYVFLPWHAETAGNIL